MPDVGVLNLQIHDDSAKAAEGLGRLVTKLEAMKSATTGMHLASVASGITKIKDAIEKIGAGDSLNKLSQLADILERIRGAAEGVNGIEIKFGSSKSTGAKEIQDSLAVMKGETQQISGNLIQATDGMVTVSSETQESAEGFNSMQQAISSIDFTKLDPSRLPIGMLGSKIGDASNAMGIFGQMAQDAFRILKDKGAFESVTAAQNLGNATMAIVPYVEQIQNPWERILQTIIQSSSALQEYLKFMDVVASRSEEAAEAQRRSKEQETAFYASSPKTKGPLTVEDTDNMASYVTQLTLLEAKLEAASQKYNKFVNSLGESDIKSIKAALEIQKLREEIEKYVASADKASAAKMNAMDTSQVTIEIGQYDLLTAKLQEAKQAYMELASSGASGSQLASSAINVHKAEADLDAYNNLQNMLQNVSPEVQRFAQEQLNAGVSATSLRNKLFDLDGELKKKKGDLSGVKDEADKVKQSFSEMAFGTGGLAGAMKRMFPTITGLIGRFKQLVKYRMLRAVITQITKGFKEGLQNYYEYSSAIKGSFAPAMDMAASSLAQMKNSIGAAAAPLIQSLIPVIQTLVNWFITAINYVNQFIALLRGQSSWSRAMPQSTKAFGEQEKAAKKTSKAVKDLLADWDELNIIQNNTSGSGTTGGTNAKADYLKMFEEVTLFDKRAQEAANAIKEAFGGILELVTEIGIGLLGWKLSRAFTGPLATIGALVAAGAVMDITWKLTEHFDEQYEKTGDEGWLIKDALKNMIGALASGTIVSTVLKGAAGIVTAGIELTVSAGITYGVSMTAEDKDRADALKKLSAIKAAIGAAAMAVGFGVGLGSGGMGLLIGLATAGTLFTLTAAVTVVVRQLKNASQIAAEAFANTGKGGISVADIYAALQAKFDEISAGYSIVIDSFAGVTELKTNLSDAFATISSLTETVRGDGKLTEKEANDFKEAWKTVFSAFEGITAKSFDTIFAGLNESLKSQNKELREQAKELKITAMIAQQNITEAEAKLKVDMDEILGRITMGTATPEDIERYNQYVEAFSQTKDKTLETLQNAVKEGTKIDFGDPDNALVNMKTYLEGVESSAEETKKLINEGYETEMSAIEEARASAKLLYSTGHLTEDQYNSALATFAEIEENFTKVKDEKLANVEKLVKDAYDQVMQQALAGYETFKPENNNGKAEAAAMAKYIQQYIATVADYFKDHGYEIEDEELRKALGMGVGVGEMAQALQEYVYKYLNEGPKVEVPVDVEPEVNTDGVSKEAKDVALDAVDVVKNIIKDAKITKMSDEEYDKFYASLIHEYGSELVNEAFDRFLDEARESRKQTVKVDVPVEPNVVAQDSSQVKNEMSEEMIMAAKAAIEGFDISTATKQQEDKFYEELLDAYGFEAIEEALKRIYEENNGKKSGVDIDIPVTPKAIVGDDGDTEITAEDLGFPNASVKLPLSLLPQTSLYKEMLEAAGFDFVNGEPIIKVKVVPYVDAGDGEVELHIWEVNPGVNPPHGATNPYGDASGGGIQFVAEMDNTEQTNNMANGVSRGMATTENTLAAILSVAQSILAKPAATSGAPTARDGRWNAQAARRFGEVTGENS